MDTNKDSVVIVGAGIIGAASAYYITKNDPSVKVTLLESEHPAAAASGKAGGFLAKWWCDGSATGDLQSFSFQLHKTLAEEFGAANIDYRAVQAYSVGFTNSTRPSKTSKFPKNVPGWINGSASVTRASLTGDTTDCAQVHPFKLTTKLIEASTRAGANLRIGVTATALLMNESGRASGVELSDGTVVPATKIIVSAGPWSGQLQVKSSAHEVQKLPRSLGMKATSVVLKAPDEVGNECLFTNFDGEDPELYPRPDGTIYVCGEGEPSCLVTMKATDVVPDDQKSARLKNWAADISNHLVNAEEVCSQSCHLPSADDGVPVIGFLGGTNETVVLAYGHTCWGICQGPGTGLLVSELILNGNSSSLDISNMSPSRF